MRQYRLIGLTGQSGAGKSTVSAVFASHGATVIDADAIVAQLYRDRSPCLKTVAASFGADILSADGTLDRRLLASRAFASAENTALLGRLVHPFVTARLLELLRGAKGVVVYDAPQLLESGADAICDCVVAVVADRALRRQRIMTRDGLSEQEADSRLNAQLGEEIFRRRADIIIENNTDRETLLKNAERACLCAVKG